MSLFIKFLSSNASLVEKNPIIGITKTILRMFEPITFPTTRSVFFLTIAATVAASSGTLVPIAIRTRPTNVEEMFNLDVVWKR